MADKKSEVKIEPAKSEVKKYILLKNVKYGNAPYKAGEEIAIEDKDIEEFKAAGAIETKQVRIWF